MTPIHQEARMFEVTTKAEEKLSEFFKARTEKPFIRIFLQQGG
jgi:Fe-S cluster assembly iron-binding protein IscA